MKNDLIIGLPDYNNSLGSEGARYCRGVTATAMVITAEQWKELCNLEPTDLDNDINRRLSTLKCKHSFIKATKEARQHQVFTVLPREFKSYEETERRWYE